MFIQFIVVVFKQIKFNEKKEKKQTETHTHKQMNEIHKMKKKEEIYKMKKMWLLMLSCKEAFIRFVFESPYSIFIFVLCPSPLHTSPVSFNFIRKKNNYALHACEVTFIQSCIHLSNWRKKTHIAPSYKRFQIFLGKGAAFEKTKHTKEKRTNLNITLPKHFWIVIGSIYFQKDHHLHNQLIF